MSLHRVAYTKCVKESQEIGCISLQSSKNSFRKIQIFKFAYSALPLFYSLFRLSHEVNLTVVILDMFISVNVYSFRFVSFRKIQLTLCSYSPESRTEVCCFGLKFNVSKLVYCMLLQLACHACAELLSCY